jgi:hypothetical protein
MEHTTVLRNAVLYAMRLGDEKAATTACDMVQALPRFSASGPSQAGIEAGRSTAGLYSW